MSQAQTEAAVALYQQAIGDNNWRDPAMKAIIRETMATLDAAMKSGTESDVVVFHKGEETHTDIDGHCVTDHFYRIPTTTNGVGMLLVVTTQVHTPRMEEVYVVLHTADTTFLWPSDASESFWRFGSYLVEKKYSDTPAV